MTPRHQSQRAKAFTLIEIVIVVIIIGIIAAIAIPKMFDLSAQASDSSVKQTLSVVRKAISTYQSQNGGQLPGQSNNLDKDLYPYLQGNTFPTCPVATRDNLITYAKGSTTGADGAPTTSWKYNIETGDFICNSGAPTLCDPSVNYDEL